MVSAPADDFPTALESETSLPAAVPAPAPAGALVESAVLVDGSRLSGIELPEEPSNNVIYDGAEVSVPDPLDVAPPASRVQTQSHTFVVVPAATLSYSTADPRGESDDIDMGSSTPAVPPNTGAPPVPAPGVGFAVGPGTEVLVGDLSAPLGAALGAPTALPPIHCSEFLQAIIEKQHEVERYLHAPTQDIHPPTLMKMAMMKNELDLLSSCIAGVLGKGQIIGQAALDPRISGGSAKYGGEVNQQIWPLDPCAGVYSAEAQMVLSTDAMTAPYMNGQIIDGNVPAQFPEDHQGPAIFQGFQPPPSYAWGRTSDAPVEPATTDFSAEQQATEPLQPAVEPVSAPRPRQVAASSPIRPPVDAPIKLALTAAMEKLQECRLSCSRLRQERRGIHVDEVEHFCSAIADRLQVAGTTLESKLEAHRKKSKLKDETIKRLHKRLQAAERAIAEADATSRQAACTSPSGESIAEAAAPAAPAAPEWPSQRGMAPSDAPHNRSEGSLLLDHSGIVTSGIPGNGASSVPAPWTPGDTSLIASLPEGDSLLGEVAADPTANLFPEGSPSTYCGGACSSSQGVAVEDRPFGASPRVLAPGASAMSAGAGAVARREGHLRRRDVDLAGQLRARDAQVEQLTTTLRELHHVTQRQIGLYKRQLHLRELMQDKDKNGQAGLVDSHGREVRRERRQIVQAPAPAQMLAVSSHGCLGSMTGASTPSYGPPPHAGVERRGARSGTTPRRVDADRSRGGPAVPPPQTAVKKEPRDKSTGTQPRSPRTKTREAPGNASPPEAAAVQRRRVSPTTPTTTPLVGRPDSAEPRGQLRRTGSQAPPLRNDGEGSTAAAAPAKAIRHRDGGAPAQAQRVVRR